MTGGLQRSYSCLRVVLAAGLLAGGATLMPAAAADLGGNCCADLEERVAELEATTARKGNRKMSLTISGQVSTAVMAWNGGGAVGNIAPVNGVPIQRSDVYVVDWEPGGGTFFSFTGTGRINPNLSAGFQVTVAFDTGARSHQVNQIDDDAGSSADGGDTVPIVTLANWYLDHNQLGRLTVGRINTATAGLSTIDLGGAGVVANAAIGYWQRGFIVTATNGVQTSSLGGWGVLLGGDAVNASSLSRGNAIMYTSPTFSGFSVAAAWGEDDVWDVALRYAGEFSGFRVAAGVGYRSNYTGLNEATKDNPGVVGPEPEQFILSGSILHVGSGLYLTGSYLNQDNDIAGRNDTTLWYVQGGISKNWTGLGSTVLYGEYARVEDGVTTFQNVQSGIPNFGSTAEIWGIGIVQHIDAAAMEVFLSYRNFSAECSNCVDLNDFDMVVSGARIRF